MCRPVSQGIDLSEFPDPIEEVSDDFMIDSDLAADLEHDWKEWSQISPHPGIKRVRAEAPWPLPEEDQGTNPDAPEEDNTTPYFVTITWPGGLAESMVKRFVEGYLGKPFGPRYWVYVLEGGEGTSKHAHLHAVIWHDRAQRTDAVSRSIRSRIFEHNDLNELSSHSRLVITRRCTDVAGSLRYTLKDHLDGDGIHANLPSDYALETVLQDCRTYWADAKNARPSDQPLFPEEGNTRTIPPSQVPDFLVKVSREAGIGTGHSFAFAQVVAYCFKRGVRFDLRNLRGYRLAVEMIVAEEPSMDLLSSIEHGSR